MSNDDFFGGFGGEDQAINADPFGADPTETAVSTFVIDDGGHDDPFASAPLAPSPKAAEGVKDMFAVPAPQEDEESALSIWQTKRKAELAAQSDKERADKADLVAEAKVEVETLIKNRLKATEAKKVQNRTAEKAFRADLDAVMEHGTMWEKVAKLVDLKPKNAGKDDQATARMRNLLVQLKSQKDAPGR